MQLTLRNFLEKHKESPALQNDVPEDYIEVNDDENIIFEKDGTIGLLKVNRPKSLNALNPATVKEIAACLEEVRQDSSIRCLIVTGEGDRAFVAGADISAMVRNRRTRLLSAWSERVQTTGNAANPGHRRREWLRLGRWHGISPGVRLDYRGG